MSNRNGGINIQTNPVLRMYQLDAIATYTVDDETYVWPFQEIPTSDNLLIELRSMSKGRQAVLWIQLHLCLGTEGDMTVATHQNKGLMSGPLF